MTLAEISAIISTRSPYQLISLVEDHDAVIGVLGKPAPDGKLAVTSIAISRLCLAEAVSEEELIEARTDEATEALTRYLDSFAPAPKWDEMQWGP